MATNNGKGKGGVNFRRFRRTSSGKVLDAYDYGYKAWPFKPKG